MNGEWIDVKASMPKGDSHVLAGYYTSNKRWETVIAFYAARFSIEDDYYEEGHRSEYSEDKDCYYLESGWYEVISNWGDFSSIYIYEGEVTHWQPLPSEPVKM